MPEQLRSTGRRVGDPGVEGNLRQGAARRAGDQHARRLLDGAERPGVWRIRPGGPRTSGEAMEVLAVAEYDSALKNARPGTGPRPRSCGRGRAQGWVSGLGAAPSMLRFLVRRRHQIPDWRPGEDAPEVPAVPPNSRRRIRCVGATRVAPALDCRHTLTLLKRFLAG